MVPLRALLGQLAREEVQLPVELRGKSGILHIDGCYGVVFWDYIGQVYFPQRAQWGKTREILEFAGELTESWEPRDQKCQVSFVEEELNYMLQQLAALYEFLDCTKADLRKAVAQSAHKATEYLKSLPIHPLPKPYSQRQYLLEEASLPCHFPLYDHYSNYILRSHLTPTHEDLPKAPALCMVCAATEHTETNMLVICSVRSSQGCEECVHQECYGLLQVPEEDWYCDGCQTFGVGKAKAVPCALCSILGSAVRPTININDGRLDWVSVKPYNPLKPHSPANSALLWCHVLCAKGVPGVRMRRKDICQGIDISKVASDCLNATCEICSGNAGAAIRCTVKGCKVYLHAECTKRRFRAVTEKDRDARTLRCKTHSTVNLRHARTSLMRESVRILQGFWSIWATDKNSKALFRSQVDLFEGMPSRAAKPVLDSGFILTINLAPKLKRRRVDVKFLSARPQSPPLFTSLTSTTLSKDCCPCGKPFLSALAQHGIAEEEYNQLLKDVSMVCCDKCGQWFHYRCARFAGQDCDKEWLCAACRT